MRNYLKIKQNSKVLPPQNVSQVPTPVFPQVFQDPVLEQEKIGESDVKFETALSIDIVEGVSKIPEGMVIINEGEFLMGSDIGDEDEQPDHLVFVKSFYLDQHEVTNAAYSKCVKCTRGHGGFDTIELQQPAVYVDWKKKSEITLPLNPSIFLISFSPVNMKFGSSGE